MSHMNEIIVLDDDDEEPPKPAKAKAVIHNPSKQTNGKAEESGGSSHKKKAEVISAENKALFSEFIDYCSKLTTENPEVITFLQGRYDKASPSYLDSVEFRNTVGRCLTRVQTKRSKIFVYINELCTALKANSQKRKVSLQTQALQQPTTEKTETQTLTENDAAETEKSPVKKTGSKRQIRYLENLLRIYSLEIKKLQEKELSLDELDDEDSSYIQEARLKRKLLRIFEKLCEIKDCNSLTGRVIEQRILYRGTRYPEVNRRLERFINCDRDIFPDYTDILREVERVNDKHHLSLSRKQMQSMAQDAFRELGNKLQDRRHLDMIYNFGCHLTDCYKSVNDPAQQDTSLSRRLRENRNTAMSRLDDIIRKYADMQDDGEDDHRMKTRRGPEKTKQSSSEASEEEEESEDSETDIEEELEQSNEQVDSEEEENEEEEIAADQENEADQKMDMASGAEDSEKGKEDGGDDENVMEEQEEATEQESSPASTSASSSNDKDSPNTTLESEAEAQLPASPDLPPLSNDPPDKAKSDEEHNEEPEAPESTTPTDTADQMEEEQEHNDSVLSPVDKGSEENEDAAASVIPPCDSPSDIQVDTTKHNNTQYFLPDMTVSIEKDEDDSGEDEGVAGPADDQSSEGDASETSLSPAVQEETDTNENIEESSVKRKRSIDSEAASMEEDPACTDMAENDEDDDNNDNSDNDDEGDDNGDDNDGDNNNDDDHLENSAASRGQSPSNSLNAEQEETATSAHTETADPDPCEKETDCDLSPVGSSNGVHTTTQVQSTSLNRLKLNKDKATLRDSPKPRNTQEASPPPNRKRKGMFPKKWTNNGLARYNGKEYTEGHKEKKCKRAKMDCSYTSLSSSSDSDSDSFEEDERTPGLMMTCSPRETPKKSIIKSNVSTQCDPDEVIVLSD